MVRTVSAVMIVVFVLAGCTDKTIINVPQPGDASNEIIAEPGDFNAPWAGESPALIIDIYRGNEIDWGEMNDSKMVKGVIHKASQNMTKDSKYSEQKEIAKQNGYLWGSYHLGKSGNPEDQADFYLKVISNSGGVVDADEFMALDLEGTSESDMSLSEAILFIKRIYERTGRYPALYVNDETQKTITKLYGKESVFGKTPLWYARAKEHVTDYNSNLWETYALWQFSSELNCKANGEGCPIRIPGTGHDVDVNIFNGSQELLQKLWPLDSPQARP